MFHAMRDVGLLSTLLLLLWKVLPAYIANGAPVVVVKVLECMGYQKHPVDLGMVFADGRRLLGDSKSWEGLASGILAGTLVGLIQHAVDPSYNPWAGLALGCGAMLGDLAGSFLKRRLGLRPGDPLPLVDQLLFVYCAIALAQGLGLLRFTPSESALLAALTLVLHLVTNYIAYKAKLKRVPW